MKRLALLLSLLLAPAAQAHTGYIDIKDHAFSPTPLIVQAGVLVLWRWDGPDLNHTVTGDFFESDPGKAPLQVNHKEGDTFPVLFEDAGTYTYRCRVHDDMTGTIEVEPPPDVDRTAPQLTGVRAKVDGARARIGFTVDERSSIIAQVRRPGERKVLRDSFRFVSPGTHATAVALPGQGRFQVRVVAQDDGGNFSRPVVLSVRR